VIIVPREKKEKKTTERETERERGEKDPQAVSFFKK
jgi:hypothetical protein